MRRRIERYRRVGPDPREDYTIGCIILEEPFFLEREQWIPALASFARNTVVGETYDSGKMRDADSGMRCC